MVEIRCRLNISKAINIYYFFTKPSTYNY